MSHHQQLYQWNQTITQKLPTLSKTQAHGLALWTFGMVLAGSCGLTAVVSLLAALFAEKHNTLRQRLREFYKEADKKAGEKRQTLHVETCFAGLLAWVLSWWKANQIALALDATSLEDRFVVLTVSVLYRGCAVPVAWCVLQAAQKHAWRKEWLRLLRLLWRATPTDVSVVVLADRGLYARWLYRRIVRIGWHPLLRVNSNCTFRPQGKARFVPMWSLAASPGARWSGRGTAFQGKACRLDCTLLAFYGEGHEGPWLLLTDLAPDASEACWYGMRTWVEQGFKFLKRAGWQWNHTRMTDPARVGRFWLATSVSTLWLLSEGEAADLCVAEGTFPPLLVASSVSRTTRGLASVGILRAGRNCLLVHFLRQEALPPPQFVPEPWPLLAPVARPNSTKAK